MSSARVKSESGCAADTGKTGARLLATNSLPHLWAKSKVVAKSLTVSLRLVGITVGEFGAAVIDAAARAFTGNRLWAGVDGFEGLAVTTRADYEELRGTAQRASPFGG